MAVTGTATEQLKRVITSGEWPPGILCHAKILLWLTAKLAAQAGGTWSRYASGDHLRSPSGRGPQQTHDS